MAGIGALLSALLLLGVASVQRSEAYVENGKWNGTLDCVNSTAKGNETGEQPRLVLLTGMA